MFFSRFLRKKTPIPTIVKSVKSNDLQVEIPNLCDLIKLRQIFIENQDLILREAACERYFQLLANTDEQAPSLASKLEDLTALTDPTWLVRLAIQNPIPEIRRAVLERISDPETLAHCALEDPAAANRKLAIQNLNDQPALELVLRQIGKKDKFVYRTAREKLRLLALQEETSRKANEQCAELCTKLEKLGKSGAWEQERVVLTQLDHQLEDINNQVDSNLKARYKQERERFLNNYDAHNQALAAQMKERAEQEAARVQANDLLDNLASAVNLTNPAAIKSLCEQIAADWQTLPSLPSNWLRPLEETYAQRLREVETVRQALEERKQRMDQLQKIWHQCERLLQDSKILDRAQTNALIAHGQELIKIVGNPHDHERLQALASRFDERFNIQTKQAQEQLKEFPTKFAELKEYLTAGELKKAEPLYQILQTALDLLQKTGINSPEITDFATQFHHLSPRLQELQQWSRWGSEQHREGLCADLETLSQQDLPSLVLMEQWQRIQNEWQELDQVGPPASATLRERFQAAYVMVQPKIRAHLNGEYSSQIAHWEAREQVCQQVEEFLAKVDWERVEWRRILRAEREIRRTWNAIGPGEGPAASRGLEQRFQRSLRQLDQKINAERKSNQVYKQSLITQVEALIEAPDLDFAIEQTKTLQRAWRTTVPLHQHEEAQLWQTFRAACERIFERRAEPHQIQSQSQALQENLALREEICTEACTFAATESDPQRLAAGLQKFEERWRIAQAVQLPRSSTRQWTQRWQNCRAEFERQKQESANRQRHLIWDQLRKQAELCEWIETSLIQEKSDLLDLKAAQERWAQFSLQLPQSAQQKLQERFNRAVAAAGDPNRRAELHQQMSNNLQQRRQLCLKLEIAAGIDSPPEFARERLEFQVSRLAERMSEGEVEPLLGLDQLLAEWYACGPVARDEDLNFRFTRIRSALTNTVKFSNAIY